MKAFMPTLCIAFLVFFCLSCKKKNSEWPVITYEKAEGIWQPYQVIYPNGDINNSSLTAMTIFGPYAESVQINPDKSFVPLTLITINSIMFKNDFKGVLEYDPIRRKLVFNGPNHLEFELILFDGTELWIKGVWQPGPINLKSYYKNSLPGANFSKC